MEAAGVQAFERVYEVTHRLFSSCDLKDTIAAIVDVAVEWIGADYASVILLDDEGRIADEVENLSNIKPLSKRIRARGITSRIVSSAKPVFVSDTMVHQETNPELRKSGVRSYVGMPLTVDDRVQAVLYVYSTKSHAFDDHKEMLTIIARFAELAIKNADLVEKMKTLATRDGLTGLYNYRYFHERLSEEIKRARRGGQLAIVFMDLDGFKVINDTCGHPSGDQALQHFANACRKSVRSCDVVARPGGDEVLMLLPATSGDQARLVVKRIRDVLKRTPLHFPDCGEECQSIRLMVSAGIAVCPDDSTDDRELVKIADERLFAEKRARAEARSAKKARRLLLRNA
jgi:diguanylate cyclase (GGDEF)-like protein